MKTAFPLIAGIVVALCGALLLAQPKYAAAEAERANSELSRPGEDSIQQQIVAKEHQELESLKAGNLEAFGDLLADNAVFVDAHGPASKAEVLKNVAGFRILEYAMEDVRFVRVAAESGLIAYKITEKVNSHGREFTARVYISALWRKQGGKWICLFSQETAAP